MARKNRRRTAVERIEPEQLEPPFTACPALLPKFCIYGRYPFDAPMGQGRQFVWTFRACYAAKRFVETLLKGRKFKWIADHIIRTEEGIELKALLPSAEKPGKRHHPNPKKELTWEEETSWCNDLELIMDYEYASETEANWVIPKPYCDQINNFAAPVTVRAATVETARREVRQAVGSLVSLSQICQEVRIDIKDARDILRKAKAPRHNSGWFFHPDQVDAIKETIAKRRRR